MMERAIPIGFDLMTTYVGVAFAESGRFLSTVGAARPPVGFAAPIFETRTYS